MKNYIIYKATSPSGKTYIGITSQSLKIRVQQHISLAKNGKKRPFQLALVKYNFKFKWEVLESGLDLESAENKEKYYIDMYDSTNNSKGYNLSPGGLAGSIMSDQGRVIWKQKMRKYYDNPEYIKKITKHLVDRKHTDANFSETQRKYVNDHFSNPDNRLKHSHILKDIWSNDEYRHKKSLTMGGKPFICIETNKVYYSLIDAARDCGSEDKQNIYKVLKQKRKSYKGFHFKYIENKGE